MNHLNTSKSAQDVAKKCLDVNRPINEDTWHFTGLNTQLTSHGQYINLQQRFIKNWFCSIITNHPHHLINKNTYLKVN